MSLDTTSLITTCLTKCVTASQKFEVCLCDALGEFAGPPMPSSSLGLSLPRSWIIVRSRGLVCSLVIRRRLEVDYSLRRVR